MRGDIFRRYHKSYYVDMGDSRACRIYKEEHKGCVAIPENFALAGFLGFVAYSEHYTDIPLDLYAPAQWLDDAMDQGIDLWLETGDLEIIQHLTGDALEAVKERLTDERKAEKGGLTQERYRHYARVMAVRATKDKKYLSGSSQRVEAAAMASIYASKCASIGEAILTAKKAIVEAIKKEDHDKVHEKGV